MLTKDEIKDFFILNNSHAKKELGQNFLCNEKIVTNIVDLLKIEPCDKVLEIGPGLGALSEQLVNKSDNYTVVECDAKFVDYLSRIFEAKNVNIVHQNFLRYKEFDANKIIGNLPYYITSDILEYICLNFKNLDLGVFMIQKEAYKRINAKQGETDYGVLNVLFEYVFEMDYKFKVGNQNFFPIPNVESVVFTTKRKKNIDEELINPLLKTTRALFLNRRKTILNNLNSLTKDKELSKKILLDLNIKETTRPEELSLNNFLDFTKVLLNLKLIKV